MRQEALDGKIVKVTVDGTETFLNEIPDGYTPFYSGEVLVLAGNQGDEIPTNGAAFNDLAVTVRGDILVLSQKEWHERAKNQENSGSGL